MKKITALLFNLLVMSIITVSAGLPAVFIGAGLLGGLLPGAPSGWFGMAIQKEIWESTLVDNLFADNSFLSKAFSADQYVLSGKVVHIPTAGAKATVVKNRTSLPATAVKRTDTDATYALDEYTTDPRLITNADKAELAYDSRNSIIVEDKESLMEMVANEFIYKWAATASAQIIRTSGDAVVAHLPSATGNRKLITLADVSSACFALNAKDIPSDGRYALLDAWMYKQLFDQMSANGVRDFLAKADASKGIIGQLDTFNFYMRSQAARYTNASTPAPVAQETAGAATHNAGAIFWQQNAVERALGTVQAFDNPGQATYYGDILSFLVRAGGRIRRDAGVISIVQSATT
jgi:hypothetical protein